MARQLHPAGRHAIVIFVPWGSAELSTVSVFIPAFNAALTLRETLESLANQTQLADEVIVIDDGSTDETAEIAASFAGRLPGMQVISGPNVGLSRARNKGIAASRGEYVAPIDADDICHPTYLEKMARRLDERPEAGFVYCFLRQVDMQSRIYAEPSSHEVDGWGFNQLVARNFVACGSNTVFRRTALEAIDGFRPELSYSDDYFAQMAAAWQMPVTCVPEYLVGYRDVPRSFSKDLGRMKRGNKVVDRLLRRDMPGMAWTARRWRLAGLEIVRFYLVRMEGRAGLVDWLRLAGGIAADPVRWIGGGINRLQTAGHRGQTPGPLVGRSFYEVPVTDPGRPRVNPAVDRRYRQARRMDERHAKARAPARPVA